MSFALLVDLLIQYMEPFNGRQWHNYFRSGHRVAGGRVRVKRPPTFWLLLAITSMPGMGFAQSSTSQALSGAGMVSCGQYIEHGTDKLISYMFVSWAQGFLSGLNFAYQAATNHDLLILPDSDSIKVYLDNYCRDNPLQSPVNGTIRLFRELQAREIKSPTDAH